MLENAEWIPISKGRVCQLQDPNANKCAERVTVSAQTERNLEPCHINLRRSEPITPRTPVPSKSRLAGSGVVASERPIATPLVACRVKQEEIDRGLAVSV